jgi:hypothetical protein
MPRFFFDVLEDGRLPLTTAVLSAIAPMLPKGMEMAIRLSLRPFP